MLVKNVFSRFMVQTFLGQILIVNETRSIESSCVTFIFTETSCVTADN